MLMSPQLWLLGLMQMASFGVAIVVGAWIVSLLGNSFGMPPAKAGLLGSLVLLLGIGTRPLGGALRRHVPVRPLLAVSFLMSAAGCLALASGWHSLAVACSRYCCWEQAAACRMRLCSRGRRRSTRAVQAPPWDW